MQPRKSYVPEANAIVDAEGNTGTPKRRAKGPAPRRARFGGVFDRGTYARMPRNLGDLIASGASRNHDPAPIRGQWFYAAHLGLRLVSTEPGQDHSLRDQRLAAVSPLVPWRLRLLGLATARLRVLAVLRDHHAIQSHLRGASRAGVTKAARAPRAGCARGRAARGGELRLRLVSEPLSRTASADCAATPG
jgi:hypothetical protein